ncbi:LysR family transcriptional regulator [Aurantimicrobium photophilum]|uniref:Nodulation protein D 2 n=1 Tax=Aurantimicrobium photophilum TaxID=1987356 RepID=A0A2Z3RZJ3_9MICO|nr:LysR family transcriptional regulator [Aurantimicrobium photophilum]AWR20683.1 Nodulation protein D 2 [Aurantimicrobium photophilum]
MTDLRKVDINLIVVLDAILSERNLTRAGELIGMTQPAVSGALARLRQQYDDPILVRVGRGFELTPRGEELIPVVRDAMVEISRTLELLPTFEPATSTRTFYISASDYLLSQMTSPLLSVIEQAAPGVNVEFDALPAGANVEPNDLLRRDVIIAGTGRGVPGKRQSLFSDTFVCIVDKTNPRLREGQLSLSDLADLRHVHSNFGEHVHTHVDDMLANAGISPHIGVSVQGFLPVPFAVSGSSMVGFVPERLSEQYSESLGLTIAKTPLNSVTLVEAAHWHPSKTADPALKWLVSMLRTAAEIVEFGGSAEEE